MLALLFSPFILVIYFTSVLMAHREHLKHAIVCVTILCHYPVTGEEIAALAAVNDALAERYASSEKRMAAVTEFSTLLVASRACARRLSYPHRFPLRGNDMMYGIYH